MKLPDSGIELNLRLDWSEMDMFGHINNVSYFRYLQSARVEFWEVTGLAGVFRRERKGPILASVHCDFLSPLHYPGTIRILTRLAEVGNSSFQLVHAVYSDQGRLCATGRDVLVMYDHVAHEKIPVPEVLRQMLKKQE